MELNVYNSGMVPLAVIDEIDSLIWIRRYWEAGEFKLLVPFTKRHATVLQKYNIIMKRGDTEAAEIRYAKIRKNSEGLEEIEVQGKFITNWIGKRIIRSQIITKDNTQNIIRRIVRENVINPAISTRKIANIVLNADPSAGSGTIDYTSEAYINALLGIEDAAKAAKLGFRMITNERTGVHAFSVYAGKNLTADQTENPPCIFSQEFDNIVEQEYTNSIENLKSTAYVGGEDKEAAPRVVVEVGNTASGLGREEVFINATDITQSYTDENDVEITLTDAQYKALLSARGASELEHFAETLNFSSKINTYANLRYREDYDVGDRVTCINKAWGIKINVRITEITETYQQNIESLDITFGESLPALLDTIRQITK